MKNSTWLIFGAIALYFLSKQTAAQTPAPTVGPVQGPPNPLGVLCYDMTGNPYYVASGPCPPQGL